MEFTNNLLAVLLVVAIVISVGGTMVSLNRLNHFTTTGLVSANSTGTAYLNISSSTSLRFQTAVVDFGNGTINSSFTNCTLAINGSSTITKGLGCIGFFGTNPNADDSFILENNGNTYLNVTLNFSKNASQFIGGTSPQFMFASSQNETGACANGFVPKNMSWTEVIHESRLLCDNLSFQPTSNSLRIGINLTVPVDAPQSQDTVTLTVSGEAYP